MKKTVFMFPGQGSQTVGMIKKLSYFSKELEKLLIEADDILGYSLSKIIKNGPEDKLIKTSNTQPALLVMDIAYKKAIESKGYSADIVMGHSLGEYAALTSCCSITYEEALKIVRTRGLLFEKAANDKPGKMAVVNRANPEKLDNIVKECRQHGIIEITNYNSPVQSVLSGEIRAVDTAINIINKEKIGRALELKVSAPFHSSLMKTISDEFRDYLSGFQIKTPELSFIDNVTGKLEYDPVKIREKLIKQISMPVQWIASVETAIKIGAQTFIESGPGTVLSGLLKRINKDVNIINGEKLISTG